MCGHSLHCVLGRYTVSEALLVSTTGMGVARAAACYLDRPRDIGTRGHACTTEVPRAPTGGHSHRVYDTRQGA